MATKEFGSFLPPSIASKNLQVLEAGFKSVQIADQAGVAMCYGTDLLGKPSVDVQYGDGSADR
jgi:imidazolonepropionase-like amidohydrolase